MTEQDYRSEIEYIYTRFPSFQRVGKVAYKPGIQTMQYLDNVMGNPHKNFLSIHVAGTNGKGSTSHMLASALMQLSPREFYEALLQNIPDLAEKYPAATQVMSRNGIGVPKNMMGEEGQGSIGAFSAGKSSAISNVSGLCADKSGEGSSKELNSEEGYSNAVSGKFLKVGLYTAPHLWDFRERIKVSEGNSPDSMKMVEKEYVYNFLKQYRPLFEEQNASFFEITTALAFKYFQEQKVDIAIIECGLGGRLDSTNIITPLLSIITNIGLDHCEHLGYEYTQIAAEKASIIKEKVPVIIGELGTEKPSESQPSDWKILVPYKLKSSTFYGSLQLYSQNEQINNKILSAVAGSLFCCAMNDTTSIKKVFIEKAIAMRAPIIFAEYPDRLSLRKSSALTSDFALPEMDLGGDCQKKNIKAVIIALSRLLNGAKYDCGCWKLARHPLVEYNAALKAKCRELALSKLSNNEVDLNMLAASDSIKPGNIDLLSAYNLLINRGTPATAMQGGDTSAAGLQNGDTSAAMQGGPAAHISSGRLQGGDASERPGGDTSSSAAMQGGCASSFGMQNGDTSAAMQGGPAAQNAGQDYNADHNRNIEQQCNILSDKNVEIILNAAERADNLKQQRFAALIPQLKRGIDNAAHITGLHGRWEHLYVTKEGTLTTNAGQSTLPGKITCESRGVNSVQIGKTGDESKLKSESVNINSVQPCTQDVAGKMEGGNKLNGDSFEGGLEVAGKIADGRMMAGNLEVDGKIADESIGIGNHEVCRGIEIVCDTGHNAHGFSISAPQIIRQVTEKGARRLIMIFGVVADKDLDSIIPILPNYLQRKINTSQSTKCFGTSGLCNLFDESCKANDHAAIGKGSHDNQGAQNTLSMQSAHGTLHQYNTQDIQGTLNIQNMQSTQDVQSIQSVQNINDTQGTQNTQSMYNAQNTHNVQNSEIEQSMYNRQNIQSVQNAEELQAYYYFVNAAGSRALPAEKLAAKMFANGFKGEIVSPDSPEESSVMKAVDKYLHEGARPGDFLFIGGSSYVVAERKVR